MFNIGKISHREFEGDPENFEIQWHRLKNSPVENGIIFYKQKRFPHLISPEMKVFGQKIFKNQPDRYPREAFRFFPLLDPKSRFYAELKKIDKMLMENYPNYHSFFLPMEQSDEISLRNCLSFENGKITTEFFISGQENKPQSVEELPPSLKIDTVH